MEHPKVQSYTSTDVMYVGKQMGKVKNRKIKIKSHDDLYPNSEIPQLNNKFKDMRTSNPSVREMPAYRSHRSRHASPEMQVKNKSKRDTREPRYPSSLGAYDGFQTDMTKYIAPFRDKGTGGSVRSQRSARSNHRFPKRWV